MVRLVGTVTLLVCSAKVVLLIPARRSAEAGVFMAGVYLTRLYFALFFETHPVILGSGRLVRVLPYVKQSSCLCQAFPGN